jgi:hypothetical protein
VGQGDRWFIVLVFTAGMASVAMAAAFVLSVGWP